MSNLERSSSNDSVFVDVDLQDQPPRETVSPTPSSRHLGSRLRAGWLSQLNLHPHPIPPFSLSQALPESVQGQHAIASSSTPDLHAINHKPRSVQNHDVYLSPAMAGRSMTTLEPSTLPRKVEGRYRSRLENPRSARLRPLILSKESTPAPEGVRFDSQMKPGMSMTIQDSNGELIMVRSPVPEDHVEYNERVLTPLATKYLLQTNRTKSAQIVSERPGSGVHDSPSVDKSRKKLQRNAPTSSEMSDDASDADTSLTQAAQLDPHQIPSPQRDAIRASEECENTHDQKNMASVTSDVVGLGLTESTDTKKTNLTRMLHLPPKPRHEEAKHLADFSAMMRASKNVQKKRIQSGEAEFRKRLEKEAQVRQVWDQEILPCWTRAREEQKYRDLWWDGIPQALRGRIWLRACGNNLMLSHNLFYQAIARIQDFLSSDKIPIAWLDEMEHDISQTLPSLRLFEADTGPLHEDLKNVLMAFAFVRADEASQREGQLTPDLFTLYEKYTIYVPGTASLAAMLLLNMTPAQALLALMNLISSKPWLKAMYKLGLRQADSESRSSDLLGYDRVFNALLAERMPEIYANLHKMNIRPLEYLHGWIQTLFVPWLEIDTVSHLWDIIFLDEGEATLFRIALAVMELLEPRLYVRERDELLSVLHGTNPAAIRIWRRESGSPDDQTPSRDQIYVQYMLTEQSVFRCLYAQDVWWKDLTLQRLLDRELNR